MAEFFQHNYYTIRDLTIEELWAYIEDLWEKDNEEITRLKSLVDRLESELYEDDEGTISDLQMENDRLADRIEELEEELGASEKVLDGLTEELGYYRGLLH